MVFSTMNPEEQTRIIRRVTWIGLFINIGLMIAKVITGITARSSALIADGIHSLSDLTTDIAILIGAKYWTAPADSDHPHGHGKIEQLVVLFISAVLLSVGLLLVYSAARELYAIAIDSPKEDTDLTASIPGFSAFIVAVFSVFVKEGLYRWTLKKGREIKSPATVANAWHHRSDALSSIPAGLSVLGATLGARFGFHLSFLDPLGAVIVALMIIHATWRIGRETLWTLVDTSANPELISNIKRISLSVEGVKSMHKTRTRRLGSGAVAVDLHIQVDGNLPVCIGHAIAAQVKHSLLENAEGVVDVIVHVEPSELE